MKYAWMVKIFFLFFDWYLELTVFSSTFATKQILLSWEK